MSNCKRPSGRPVPGARVERIHTMAHGASIERVFPLLCPVLEYDWIEHWRCRMVHSDSGVAELGCTFTTWFPHMGGRDTWTCIRYEPNGHIEYLRVNKNRTALLSITLEEKPGGSATTWRTTLTGVTGKGERIVEKWTEAAYQEQMGMLEKMLNQYLDTGKRLKVGRHESLKKLFRR